MNHNHNFFKIELNKSYLGAGFRASQYRFVESSQEASGASVKATWVKRWHMDEEDAYIDGYQSGYVGPIISFWGRVHSVNKFFPA